MACTDYAISLIDPLKEFLEEGICDQTAIKQMKSLEYKQFEGIINILSNQTSVNSISPSYSLYKIDIRESKFSHHLDIGGDLHGMYHTTIQADSDFILLHTLSIDSMMLYISENCKNNKRYVFIPVVFTMNGTNFGHQTALIFDSIQYKVFLFDPNGRSTYFNYMFVHQVLGDQKNKTPEEPLDLSKIDKDLINELYIEGDKLIDDMLSGYVKLLNDMFDTKYIFESSYVWNPKKFAINPHFANSLIGSGHCVITTILILHYLHVTNMDITDVFSKFGNLNQTELLYLINAYTLGIFNIVKYIKK
jgi:hypothetical protein